MLTPSLTLVQKELLQGLKLNPAWRGILEQISHQPQPYKPSGADSEELKVHEWIFESGRSHEAKRVVEFLLNP